MTLVDVERLNDESKREQDQIIQMYMTKNHLVKYTIVM